MTDETTDEQPEGADAGDAAPDEAPVAEDAAPDADAAQEAADGDADTQGEPGSELAVPEPAVLEPAHPAVDPVTDRLLLPLLLPLVSIGAILVLVLNISRLLLASGEHGSVLVGTLITVGILGGAAAISASPRLRTSTLAMITAGFVVVIVAGGLIALGPSEPESAEATTYVPPKGPAVGTLTVDALPTLKFQSTSFTIPAGIIQVDYVDKGGTHTLVFDDPKLSGFELKVPSGPKSEKVELKPGDYTIFCTIPGHRAAGMEAEVTVQEGAAAPTDSTTAGGDAGGTTATTTAGGATTPATGGATTTTSASGAPTTTKAGS